VASLSKDMEGRWVFLRLIDCRQLAGGGELGSKKERERMETKRWQYPIEHRRR
jgi:hypothetical protein